MKALELRGKLIKLQRSISNLDLIPLGHGYFDFKFKLREGLNIIQSLGSWNFKPSLMLLTAQTSNFRPKNLKTTHAQVWLGMHGLPIVYWEWTTWYANANSIGTPFTVYELTRKKLVAFFAFFVDPKYEFTFFVVIVHACLSKKL